MSAPARAFLAASMSRDAGELCPRFSPVLALVSGSSGEVEVPPPDRAGVPCRPPGGCILPRIDRIPQVICPRVPSPRASAVEGRVGGKLIVGRMKEQE